MDAAKFHFEKFEQEKQRLASLRKYEPLVSDTDQDLDKLVKIAAFICQTPISLVNLVESNHTIFKAAVGTDLKGSPREVSFCAKAIMGTGVFEIPDATLDDRFKDNPLVTGPHQLRYYAGSPLVNKEGMNMGTICVFGLQPQSLSPEQKESLQTLGEMAVMIIENRKQAAVLHRGNLSAVLTLESKLSEMTKQMESYRKFLPADPAALNSSGTADDETVIHLKRSVILQCSISYTMVGELPGTVSYSFISSVYRMLSDTVSTYHGTVQLVDGNHISALFSEPLSMFPHDENALYCAFELLNKFQLLKFPEGISANLAIILHCGDVVLAPVSINNRIDYTVFGKAIEESKRIRDRVPEFGVYLSTQVYKRVSNVAMVIETFNENDSIDLKAYQVKLIG